MAHSCFENKPSNCIICGALESLDIHTFVFLVCVSILFFCVYFRSLCLFICSIATRGTGANCVLFDEAAFIPVRLFMAIAVPLMGVEDTAVLAISTPKGKLNYYNKLTKTKYNGDYLFKVIKLGLVCDKCERAGKESSCRHMLHMLPSWKPPERLAMTTAITRNFPEIDEAENKGLDGETTNYLFPTKALDSFVDAELLYIDERVGSLSVAVDPAGGGNSRYVITTTAKVKGYDVIVGMDSLRSREIGPVSDFIKSHIKRLRSRACFASSLIVLFVEANGEWVRANTIANLVKSVSAGPIYVEQTMYKGELSDGVMTTERRKKEYYRLIQCMLLEDTLRFSLDFVSSDPGEEMESLVDEMRKYREEITEDNGRRKVTITGKSSAGDNDDRILALQMSFYFKNLKMQDNQFVQQMVMDGHNIDE